MQQLIERSFRELLRAGYRGSFHGQDGIDIRLVAGLVVIILIIIGFVMWRMLTRRYEHATSGIVSDEVGWKTVPLVAAFSGWRWLPWWLATGRNNVNPELSISGEAIRYRTIMLRTRPIGDIDLIDVRTAFGTVNLQFLFRGSARTFSANVGTRLAARKALRLFQPKIPLSARARNVLAESS